MFSPSFRRTSPRVYTLQWAARAVMTTGMFVCYNGVQREVPFVYRSFKPLWELDCANTRNQ